jgi:hypothetical protein
MPQIQSDPFRTRSNRRRPALARCAANARSPPRIHGPEPEVGALAHPAGASGKLGRSNSIHGVPPNRYPQ